MSTDQRIESTTTLRTNHHGGPLTLVRCPREKEAITLKRNGSLPGSNPINVVAQTVRVILRVSNRPGRTRRRPPRNARTQKNGPSQRFECKHATRAVAKHAEQVEKLPRGCHHNRDCPRVGRGRDAPLGSHVHLEIAWARMNFSAVAT